MLHWASREQNASVLKRAPSTTAIFNRNRNFQRQPRTNFPCMGSSNRNHHRNLQVAVTVAVEQNFLIFGGRSLKSRLRWCMGRSDQICHISTDICMLLNSCIDTNEIFPDKQEVKYLPCNLVIDYY